jgi:putative sterol carrier protein
MYSSPRNRNPSVSPIEDQAGLPVSYQWPEAGDKLDFHLWLLPRRIYGLGADLAKANVHRRESYGREILGIMANRRVVADQSTEDFFEQLARRGHEPLLARASGTLAFDLADGRQTKRWLVTVDKGQTSISRRKAAADFVLRADKAIFDRITSGELNALAAALRGTIEIEGDLELIILFQRLFPAPPASPKS